MLVFPQINLNGTDADELCQQARTAFEAIYAAEKALHAMTPHGRDYQTLPADAYRTARNQHEARLWKLEEIKVDVLAIFHAVMDQRAELKPLKS